MSEQRPQRDHDSMCEGFDRFPPVEVLAVYPLESKLSLDHPRMDVQHVAAKPAQAPRWTARFTSGLEQRRVWKACVELSQVIEAHLRRRQRSELRFDDRIL